MPDVLPFLVMISAFINLASLSSVVSICLLNLSGTLPSNSKPFFTGSPAVAPRVLTFRVRCMRILYYT